MTKYAPLEKHLRNSGQKIVPMTFEDIENVIGSELPSKSSKQRAWWSNNATNNVMTKAWLAAGYESTRVDIVGRKLVFHKATPDDPPQRTSGGPQPPRGEGAHAAGRNGSFSRVFGALKGTVTIAPGTDLTAPIGEEWDAER